MLGGIALLTTVIGKASTSVGDIWRRNMKGQGDCSALTGHTLLVGWDGETSERIVELLGQDTSTSRTGLVICDSIITENPMPGRASFIKGDSLDSPAVLLRAGAIGAQRILVHTQSDSLTLAIVLTLKSLGPTGHVVAHFNNPNGRRWPEPMPPNWNARRTWPLKCWCVRLRIRARVR